MSSTPTSKAPKPKMEARSAGAPPGKKEPQPQEGEGSNTMSLKDFLNNDAGRAEPTKETIEEEAGSKGRADGLGSGNTEGSGKK
jgi:hypothetical protein